MNSAVAQGPVALLDTLAPTRPSSSSALQASPTLALDDAEEIGALRVASGPATPDPRSNNTTS